MTIHQIRVVECERCGLSEPVDRGNTGRLKKSKGWTRLSLGVKGDNRYPDYQAFDLCPACTQQILDQMTGKYQVTDR